MSFTPADGSAWLRAFLDESPVAVGFSRDGVTMGANPAYVRMFGYDAPSEIVGRPILEQIAPSDRGRILEIVQERARGGVTPANYAARGLRKDGSEFPFEIAITRVMLADGPLTVAFVFDVSELRASEERYRTLSRAAAEGIFVHDGGKIVDANAAGETMYGFGPGEMIGHSLIDLTAPESRAVLLEQVRSGGTGPYEGLAQRKDGSTFRAEVRARTLVHQGRPARVAIIRDVTEQRALAERVRQAQKLESLGMLAGGVAHDFNNILTVITNEVALARGGDAPKHLDNIAMAASRAAELCRQLLAYAGKAPLVREAVEVDALIEGTAGMLDVSVAPGVKLARRLAGGLPRIIGDATQLRQVVMNLVLNASEASARTITIATGAGAIAEPLVAGEAKAGVHVWIEVEDDGAGMDAATVARVFDPFFTTKFVGRGLGMAAVLGIVRGHDGAIAITSTPGQGTRIRVYFPVSAASPEASASPLREPHPRRCVLLVEDEANVRRSTQMLLEGLGFDVLVACDGVEAVETFRAKSPRIDAVLLDLAMPRLGGLEALAALRAIAPDVRVVLTSGYGEVPATDVAVLAKPYSAQQLVDALERVIRR